MATKQKSKSAVQVPDEIWLARDDEEAPSHAEPLDVLGDIIIDESSGRTMRVVVARAGDGCTEANMRRIVEAWNGISQNEVDLREALLEAKAGLEFATAKSCTCRGRFICTVHKAMESVNVVV